MLEKTDRDEYLLAEALLGIDIRTVAVRGDDETKVHEAAQENSR